MIFVYVKSRFVNHFRSTRVCAGTHNLNQTQLSYDICREAIHHIIDCRGFSESESESVSGEDRIRENCSSYFRDVANGFLATAKLKSFSNFF